MKDRKRGLLAVAVDAIENVVAAEGRDDFSLRGESDESRPVGPLFLREGGKGEETGVSGSAILQASGGLPGRS